MFQIIMQTISIYEQGYFIQIMNIRVVMLSHELDDGSKYNCGSVFHARFFIGKETQSLHLQNSSLLLLQCNAMQCNGDDLKMEMGI